MVLLRPVVYETGLNLTRLRESLRRHLAAGLPLATYLKPDGKKLDVRASRQQLCCVNSLIDDYASDTRFALSAKTFGPIKDN